MSNRLKRKFLDEISSDSIDRSKKYAGTTSSDIPNEISGGMDINEKYDGTSKSSDIPNKIPDNMDISEKYAGTTSSDIPNEISSSLGISEKCAGNSKSSDVPNARTSTLTHKIKKELDITQVHTSISNSNGTTPSTNETDVRTYSSYTLATTDESNSSYSDDDTVEETESYDSTVGESIIIEQEEEYFKLAEIGDLESFIQKKQVNLMQDRDKDGNTYLHRCITDCMDRSSFRHRENMISYIISNAPLLINIKNKCGETPLCMACKCVMHEEIISLLANINPNMLDETDKNGATPLHYVATSYGLLKYDQHYPRQLRDHDDVTENSLLIAEQFIELGADVNIEDKNGMNVLHYAIEQKESYNFYKRRIQDNQTYINYVQNMLNLLQEHGASLVSKSGKHALHFVQSARDAKWVFNQDCEILYKEPSPNEKTILFHTITKLGGTKEGDKIIDIFIRHGATVECPFELITLARLKKCNFYVIELLLKRFPHKYGINELNLDGQTLLTQYKKDKTIIKKLLAMGANINFPNKDGSTLLWIEAKNKSINSIKEILDLGADPGIFSNANVCVLLPICHKFTTKTCKLQPILEILSHILNYPSIKAFPMSESLEKVFGYVFADLFNAQNWFNIQNRLKDILICIFNSNQHIKSIVFTQNNKENYYIVGGYTLDYQSYDFMGYAIHCYTKTLKSTLEFSVEKLNNTLLDCGISVSNTSNGCISALTSALIASKVDNVIADFPGAGQSYSDKKEMNRVISNIIQLGVKTNIQALQIKGIKSEILNQEKKDIILVLIKKTCLPDALLLALLRNKMKLAKKLISVWCGPPLALMIFNPNWNYAEFIPWFEMLQSYGRIPHGTPMFQLMMFLLHEVKEDSNREFTMGRDIDFSYKFQAFKKHLETISSLQELCTYAVRQNVAKAASQPGNSLSDLLHNLLPPQVVPSVIY